MSNTHVTRTLKTVVEQPATEWSADNLHDETRFNSIAMKLDRKGTLILDKEGPCGHLGSTKTRIYHLDQCTVDLSQHIDWSLNQYRVSVNLRVYHPRTDYAKRILGSLV
jgi:hypothetical protein